RRGLADHGLSLPETLIARGALNRSAGEAATARLLDLPEPPSAIVFALDRAALGAYRPAAERGLHVGRDLAVIAYDGDPEGAYAEPPLATWSVDWGKAGARLADMLIRRVRGEPISELRATMPATFLDRGSASVAPNADPAQSGADAKPIQPGGNE
ncbi:MAG: substrate-binding domain-containing protein, partial [Pseudomonadota bacterium]